MKNITISFLVLAFLVVGCEDTYLDLEPLDATTEIDFFNSPDDFEAAANNLYLGLQSYSSTRAYGGSEFNNGFADITDFGTDLNAWVQPVGQGSNIIDNEDLYWHNGYGYLREANVLLEKAALYEGDASEIAVPVATAYFFRAWQHFTLLTRFGGVPLATTVLEVGDENLYGARSSRYEVVEQVLADLDTAMSGLPDVVSTEATGKVSKYAAEALKAKILLYEGTWEKYVGNTTDFQGSSSSDNSAAYISAAITAAKSVMDNGGYEIWNHNDVLDNLSYRYLFVLEDGASNPAGLDKSSNNEFIIQSVFDFNLKQGGAQFAHVTAGRNSPSRKILDMFVSLDGLPISKSPLFQGYSKLSDQFIDRDYRMISYFGDNIPEDGSLPMTGISSTTLSPIVNQKFRPYNYPIYRATREESYNYSQLRLAEIYLTYAEALYERDGSISDADLNISINVIRERAGVAPLTNAVVSANDLDMLEEIRRERTVELYMENNRFNDLKRWGIAEEVLGEDLIGEVIEGTEYETDATLYAPENYIYGTKKVETGSGLLDAVIIDPASVRNFSLKNYLFPIPTNEIILNPELVQNPGW